MRKSDIPDHEVEAVISGSGTPPGLEDVAQVFDELRATPLQEVEVGAQLGEFVTEHRSPAPAYELILEATAPAEQTGGRRRRQSAFARMALVVGISVAGITGAHAVGLVDVPGLPGEGDAAELVAASTSEPPAAAPQAVVDDPAPGAGIDPKISFNSDEDGEITADIELGGVSASVRITNVDGVVTVDIDVEGVSAACEAAIEAVHDISDTPDARAKIEAAEAACASELALIGPLLGDGDTLAQLLENLQLDLTLPERFGNLDELFSGKHGEFGEIFGDGFSFEAIDPDQLEELFEDFEFPEGLEEFLNEHMGEFLGGEDGGFGIFGGEFGFDPDEFEELFKDFNSEDFEKFFSELPLPEGFDELFTEGFDPEQLEAQLEELLSGLEADLGIDLEELFGTFGSGLYGEDEGD